MSRRCLGGVQEVSRRCPGGVQEVSRRWSRRLRPPLEQEDLLEQVVVRQPHRACEHEDREHQRQQQLQRACGTRHGLVVDMPRSTRGSRSAPAARRRRPLAPTSAGTSSSRKSASARAPQTPHRGQDVIGGAVSSVGAGGA